MVKLYNKIIFKIIWDNIVKVILSLKNNKPIKIIKVLIELLNKECLMIEVEKLLNKKLGIISNKLIIIIILINKMLLNLILIGEILIII
jgi:hypothetical protein